MGKTRLGDEPGRGRVVAHQPRLLVADVSLKESGCKFSEQIRVIRGETTYAEFKAECEQRFDQRLQLSFTKAVKVKELGFAASLAETCPDLAGILHKSQPPTRTAQVSLSQSTWDGFVNNPDSQARLKVRAWGVFNGVSLKGANQVSSRQEIITQLEKGTEGLPSEKRLPALKRKLDGMCSVQLMSLHSQTLGEGHTLNLFKTMSSGSREKTVERLWDYARTKNTRRLDDEKDEAERVKQRLRLPSRRVTPSAQEEACADRLYAEPMAKRQQTLEDLDAKYSAKVPQVKKVHMPDDAVSELVGRLYGSPGEDQTRKMNESMTKVYGLYKAPKKLGKAELENRIDSLYSKALDKKEKSILNLSQQYSSPRAPVRSLSPEEDKGLLERLTTPK